MIQLLLDNNNEIAGKDKKGFTVVHKAVKEGKLGIVKLLLGKGCSVKTTDNSGITPLSTAAENGDTQLVQILLEHDASINTKDAKGMSAFHKAIEKGNKDIVQMLINKGSSVNDTTTYMTTPLQIAVQKQNESIVKLLLDQGAFVDAEDKDNKSALCFAVEANIGILDLLLNSKPNVDTKSNKSALRLSIVGKSLNFGRKKQVEMVTKLLSYGFTIRSEDIEDKELFEASVRGGYIKLVEYILLHNSKLERVSTVVNLSVMNKDQEMVELLLNYGFHADVQDFRKNAPMSYAYAQYELNMCKFLLSKGVNINSKIHRSCTLLHVAIANKPNKEFIKYLLEQGANINAITESNSTSLHIACEKGYEDIVMLLLKYKADIHVKDKDGFTALHKAIKADNEKIAGNLFSRGSDINATTNSMLTPLHLAVLHSRGTMVFKLLNCPVVDLNAKDSTKKTALHNAVLNRSTYNISAFLDKNPDLEDINNKLALCLAIIGKNSECIVNIFLRRCFSIVAEDFEKFEIPEPLHSKLEAYSVQEKFMRVSQELLKRQATTEVLFQYQVLQASVKNGFLEIVRQLLKQDMNLNALLDNGQTLLHDAIESSQFRVAEELLKYGAKINALDERKRTPLHIVILSNSAEGVAFLLKLKADLEARNEEGETALHLAVDRGNLITEFILKAGANVNSVNKKGDTPLHLAAGGQHEDIAQLLLDYDAEIDVENEKKEKPLDIAKHSYRKAVLKLLLKYGSKYSINGNDTNLYGSSEFIMEHAIKMQAANLNDIKVEVPPHMDDFRKKCEDEVERIKFEKIGRNISMFDFFTKRQGKIAAFTNNKDIMKIINTTEYEDKFPLYSSMLEIRINKGKTRNELMEKGATCLGYLLENLELKIPDLVIQEIFSFLRNRDLRNLIYASPIELEENSSDLVSNKSMLEQLFGPEFYKEIF